MPKFLKVILCIVLLFGMAMFAMQKVGMFTEDAVAKKVLTEEAYKVIAPLPNEHDVLWWPSFAGGRIEDLRMPGGDKAQVLYIADLPKDKARLFERYGRFNLMCEHIAMETEAHILTADTCWSEGICEVTFDMGDSLTVYAKVTQRSLSLSQQHFVDMRLRQAMLEAEVEMAKAEVDAERRIAEATEVRRQLKERIGLCVRSWRAGR